MKSNCTSNYTSDDDTGRGIKKMKSKNYWISEEDSLISTPIIDMLGNIYYSFRIMSKLNFNFLENQIRTHIRERQRERDMTKLILMFQLMLFFSFV